MVSRSPGRQPARLVQIPAEHFQIRGRRRLVDALVERLRREAPRLATSSKSPERGQRPRPQIRPAIRPGYRKKGNFVWRRIFAPAFWRRARSATRPDRGAGRCDFMGKYACATVIRHPALRHRAAARPGDCRHGAAVCRRARRARGAGRGGAAPGPRRRPRSLARRQLDRRGTPRGHPEARPADRRARALDPPARSGDAASRRPSRIRPTRERRLARTGLRILRLVRAPRAGAGRGVHRRRGGGGVTGRRRGWRVTRITARLSLTSKGGAGASFDALTAAAGRDPPPNWRARAPTERRLASEESVAAVRRRARSPGWFSRG